MRAKIENSAAVLKRFRANHPEALPAAAVACGFWSLAHPDRDPGDPAYARDALECIDQTKARLLCGGYAEIA